MAYYQTPRSDSARGFVQLAGRVEDNRIRLIDTVRDATANTVRVQEDSQGMLTFQPPFRVSEPGLPFAMGMFDDRRVFLARAMNSSKAADHRKVLEQLPWFAVRPWPPTVGFSPEASLLTGYHPPWVRTALGQIPFDACGFCLGEIPTEGRKWLSDTLKLRATPRRFAFFLKRDGDGVGVSLRLNMDKAGAELLLQEDLEKWRRDGLGELQARFPDTRKEPEAIALLAQVLNANMRWGANPGSEEVTTSFQIPGPSWKALGALVKRLVRTPQELP